MTTGKTNEQLAQALDLLKKARTRLESLEAQKRDPIAIVGLGCRFAGCSSPAELWQLLCDGRDAITEIPKDRWDAQAYFSADIKEPGKMTTRWGGFVKDIDRFDAAFFGITP